MAISGEQPFIKVTDSNGLPIVGAVLKVYEVGTTTNRPIWSDAALTVPMTNPLSGANASNASGDFPRFYMAAGTYKLRAETLAGTLIWEYDNIETGLSVGTGALPIANGGTGASTAPAAVANLGAALASDVTALAAQISGFVSTLGSLTSVPQGRLTLTSATPVLVTDKIAATSVFYTPYIGQLCPVWDGVQFNSKVFAELTLTLNASHVLSSIYDVYMINDAVAGIIIVTGPAWSNIAAGTCSRSGTADISRLKGLWVNTASMTARNGATTYTVAASQGTYLGSIFMDGTNGQISCLLSYGQSRKWGVWNAYNRKPLFLKAGDPTASWTYNTATIRASNNSAANSLTVFSGVAEEVYDLALMQKFTASATGNQNTDIRVGIGINVSSAQSGKIGISSAAIINAVALGHDLNARYIAPPSLGINNFFATEYSSSTTGTPSFFGTEVNMLLSAAWNA